MACKKFVFLSALAFLLFGGTVLDGTTSTAEARDTIKIGMTVSLTGPHTHTGWAIRRGAETAVDWINENGGVLGKKLELVVLDDAGDPPQGVANTRRLANRDRVVTIIGGYHSTVGLAMRAPIHQIGIPYISPYCANTEIIENNYDPNYMFRVSAKDRWVSETMVNFAVNGLGNKNIATINENTGWGTGGRRDILAALEKAGIEPLGDEIFNWGDTDMTPQLMRLRRAGAEVLIGYFLDPEGAQLVRSMEKIGYHPQIISAWGISGNFADLAGYERAEGAMVNMTYTWCGELCELGTKIYEYIKEKYKLDSCKDFMTGSGTANAYDAINILALAIEKAGTAEVPKAWPKIREALLEVEYYDGLITTYDPPFEPYQERHDAILAENYVMCAWHDGSLLPITQTPQWDKLAPGFQEWYLDANPRAREIMERMKKN